ncbi:hypothetical protein FOZ63_014832, partial [Perkinsus olseni]
EELAHLVRAIAPDQQVAALLCRHGLTTPPLIGSLPSHLMERVGAEVAGNASFYALTAEVSAAVAKRRKLATDAELSKANSSVNIGALVERSVQNYSPSLPPSVFHGVSQSTLSAVASQSSGYYVDFKKLLPEARPDNEDDRVLLLDLSKAARGESAISESSKKGNKQVSTLRDYVQCLLKYARLVSCVLPPADLSPCDVIAHGLRIISLVGSISMDLIISYDDIYCRSVSTLVASTPSLSIKQCFSGDAYPTLLVEYSQKALRVAASKQDKPRPTSRSDAPSSSTSATK